MFSVVFRPGLVIAIYLIVTNFYSNNGVSATVVVEINFAKNGTARGVTSSETSEAEAIALDTTDNFLPTPELVSKISRELRLIRTQFPDMKNITYSGKFIPGQVMAQNLTIEKLKAVDASEFGPLASYRKLRRGSLTLLEFKMPYNPYQLGELIKTRFGLDNSPVILPSLSSSISYEPSSSSRYTFKSGKGNCFVREGCTNWISWSYSVSDNATVSIVLDLH